MHVAVVHNNIDQASAIGKLASWAVQTALDAGHHVTAVARDLDPTLRELVDWRPLYVPPKLHAVQWAAGRKTVQAALRGVRPDVLHVYQPQLASIADTWHVQYLSRVAVETDSLHRGPGLKDHIARAQQLAVAEMEDRYLSRLSHRPTVLFCSEPVRDHFRRLYGEPSQHDVLLNPSFAGTTLGTPPEAARAHFELPRAAFVVGYLGGKDERKGYRELLDAVASLDGSVHLLAAGPGSEHIHDGRLGQRLHRAGMLSELGSFWGAIDVLAVPSRFDPFAMVVTEAASAGVPSLVTPGVGAASLVEKHRAGRVSPSENLGDAIADMRGQDAVFTSGCRAMSAAVDSDVLGRDLHSFWMRAHERRRR